MSKILSQAEIDHLLRSTGELAEADPSGDPDTSDGVVVYNFRRPDRLSKDQIRSLHFLHDRFARNVATSLSAYLRTVTEADVVSVEQFTYSEFLASLPDPTAFYALSMAPLEGLAALELNPAVAFSMIDRMLGGSGRITAIQRGLTEIEQDIVDAVVRLIVENLTESWRSIAEVQFRITGRETRPQMLQVAARNEVVVQLGFHLRLAEAQGMLNLCIPAAAIESVGANFARTWHGQRRDPTPSDRQRLHESLARVLVPVTVSLDTTLKARELLDLAPGDVLSLGSPLQDPLDLRVGGTVKFKGRLSAAGPQTSVHVLQAIASVAREV